LLSFEKFLKQKGVGHKTTIQTDESELKFRGCKEKRKLPES